MGNLLNWLTRMTFMLMRHRCCLAMDSQRSVRTNFDALTGRATEADLNNIIRVTAPMPSVAGVVSTWPKTLEGDASNRTYKPNPYSTRGKLPPEGERKDNLKKGREV